MQHYFEQSIRSAGCFYCNGIDMLILCCALFETPHSHAMGHNRMYIPIHISLSQALHLSVNVCCYNNGYQLLQITTLAIHNVNQMVFCVSHYNFVLFPVADICYRPFQTHVNPCFLRPDGISEDDQETLNKDQAQLLEHGDIFGLLPEKFYFKVVYKNYKYVDLDISNLTGVVL